jgi:hypothetical protein
MKLYSSSYFERDGKKLPNTTTHYILPFFYKDRSLIIFRFSTFRKNYFMFNTESSFMDFGVRVWGNNMIELNIFAWEY